MGHKPRITWVCLVILFQCKQIVNVTHTWANCLLNWIHIKSSQFIVKASFSTVFPLFSFSAQPTGQQPELMHLCPSVCACQSAHHCLPSCLLFNLFVSTFLSPVCHLHYMFDSCQASFLSLPASETSLLPCQTH